MRRFIGLLTSSFALAMLLATAGCPSKSTTEDQKEPDTTEPATKPVEPTEPAPTKAEPAEPAEPAQPAAAAATGVESCDQLIDLYAKCDKIPQASRDAFLQSSAQWKKAVETGGDAAKTQLESTCKQTLESAKESFKAVGC